MKRYIKIYEQFIKEYSEKGGKDDIEFATDIHIRPYFDILIKISEDFGRDSDLYNEVFNLFVEDKININKLINILKNYDVYNEYSYLLKFNESALVNHAKNELQLAGMYDEDDKLGDISYNKMVADAVVELMQKFSEQDHSGFSAGMVRELFNKLSQFQTLTDITNNPDEWLNVAEYMNNEPMWQNKRNPAIFSKDGGKTWYNIDESVLIKAEELVLERLNLKFPFNEIKIKDNIFIREFNSNLDSTELVWHRDKEDRKIKVLESNNWYLQLDNELPILLEENKEYFIPKETFHRIIKGSSNLKIELHKL